MNLKKLREPIPLKWRVQRAFPKGNPTHVIMTGYIDSRDVQDRLDDVCSPAKWMDEYQVINGNLYCGISIEIDHKWITKWDVGVPSKTEREKGEASDAFKRAAVKWGINRVAYQVEQVKLPCKSYGNRPYPVDETGKFLKGQELYDKCNELAEFSDFVLQYENSLEEVDPSEELKSSMT